MLKKKKEYCRCNHAEIRSVKVSASHYKCLCKKRKIPVKTQTQGQNII